MKNGMFVLVACLISFIFLSCNNEDNGNEIEMPSGELLVVKSSDSNKAPETVKDIIFMESDVKSFCVSTGEIVFNDFTAEEIEKRMINSNNSSLTYYIGDTQLFSSIFAVPKSSSAVYNDLSLVIVDSKCFLLNGYPSLDIIGYNKDEHKQEREKNAFKNQKAWDIFIKHLGNEGKIKK